MIPKLTFGRTGHLSTRTLFGAAAFSEVSQAEADRTLELLYQYGVNHIDTAASYGEAELRLGPWVAHHRNDFSSPPRPVTVPIRKPGNPSTVRSNVCRPTTWI